MDRRARIEERLRERLDPSYIEVVDESHLHAGHAGAATGAGHFRAVLVSSRFEGLSPVEAQRMVYEALDDMMGQEIHALSIRALTPERWKQAQDDAG